MLYRFHTMLQVMRGDVRHLPRVILFTILSMAIYNFGWGFADPFFGLYLGEFAYDYTVVGLFQTLASITAVAMLFPVGDLLDRVNNGRVLVFAKCGYAGVGLLYFCAGQFHSMPLLIMALLANGFFMPFVWTGTISTLEDYSNKKNAGITFGLYFTSYRLAWTFGLLLSLWLVWKFPIHYIFIPVIIFPMLSAMLNTHQPDKGSQGIASALHDVIVRDKLFYRVFQQVKTFNLEIRMLYVFFFALSSIQVVAMIFLPLYAFSMGWSIVQVGLLVLVINIPFLLSFVSAEIADHSERMRNVIIGTGISAIAAGLLSIWPVSNIHIVLFAFLLNVGYSIIVPSLSSMISVLTPKQYTGTGSAMMDLGTFGSALIFSPIIGYIIDTRGWNRMFLFGALFLGLVTCLVAIFQIILKRRNLLYHINHPKSRNNPYII